MNVKSDSFVSFSDGKPEVTTIERLTDTASQPSPVPDQADPETVALKVYS